jgi:NAD(P)-dependent dehydrogenase (short-subunit alcohol dehydrogenase family)
MPLSAPQTTRLDGKVALITGSSRGMGRQNALELASRGADIVVNYSSSAPAAEAIVKSIEAMGRQAIAIRADISQPDAIADLFLKAYEHFKHIDIVVSNSGVESFGHISEITPQEFDRVFSVNTRGQLLVAH